MVCLRQTFRHFVQHINSDAHLTVLFMYCVQSREYCVYCDCGRCIVIGLPNGILYSKYWFTVRFSRKFFETTGLFFFTSNLMVCHATIFHLFYTHTKCSFTLSHFDSSIMRFTLSQWISIRIINKIKRKEPKKARLKQDKQKFTWLDD